MLLVIEQDGRAVGACDVAELPSTLERLRREFRGWFDVWDASGARPSDDVEVILADRRGIPHGTPYRADYYGCPCDACRDAKRASNARSNRNRRRRRLEALDLEGVSS